MMESARAIKNTILHELQLAMDNEYIRENCLSESKQNFSNILMTIAFRNVSYLT